MPRRKHIQAARSAVGPFLVSRHVVRPSAQGGRRTVAASPRFPRNLAVRRIWDHAGRKNAARRLTSRGKGASRSPATAIRRTMPVDGLTADRLLALASQADKGPPAPFGSLPGDEEAPIPNRAEPHGPRPPDVSVSAAHSVSHLLIDADNHSFASPVASLRRTRAARAVPRRGSGFVRWAVLASSQSSA